MSMVWLVSADGLIDGLGWWLVRVLVLMVLGPCRLLSLPASRLILMSCVLVPGDGPLAFGWDACGPAHVRAGWRDTGASGR